MSYAGAAIGGAVLGGGLAGSAAGQDTVRIRHGWWGNPERDRRTFEVIDVFNARGLGIEVAGETANYNDYFTRLATQGAGGNLPDCLQMGTAFFGEYIERGMILPLDPWFGKTIDIDGVDENAIRSNSVDGKLYALSHGANSHVTLFNKRLVEAAGETFDPIEWTYEDLKRVAVAIANTTPDGVYGTDDLTGEWLAFDIWLRQNGKPGTYTEDGSEPSFDAQDLIGYWSFWEDMRQAGACAPGAETVVEVGSSDLAATGLVTGKTAMSYAWSNQVGTFQNMVKDPLGTAMRPHLAGGKPGQYIKPSQSICLSRDAVDPEAATTYINALIQDPEITAIIGMERGIPEVASVREMLKPDLTESEAAAVAYFDSIQGRVAPLPPPPPLAEREVWDAFSRTSVNVLLGTQPLEQTAEAYAREARAIMRRA